MHFTVSGDQSEGRSRSLVVEANEAEQKVSRVLVDNSLLRSNFEEVVQLLEGISLDELGLGNNSCAPDHFDVCVCRRGGSLNHVGSDLKGKGRLLRVSFVNQRSYFFLDLGDVVLKLGWVATSDSLKALKSVQTQLSLDVAHEVKEVRQELGQVFNVNQRGVA